MGRYHPPDSTTVVLPAAINNSLFCSNKPRAPPPPAAASSANVCRAAKVQLSLIVFSAELNKNRDEQTKTSSKTEWSELCLCVCMFVHPLLTQRQLYRIFGDDCARRTSQAAEFAVIASRDTTRRPIKGNAPV